LSTDALGRLRTAARFALVAGAVGSVALTVRAGLSTPRLLLVLFVLWVLSPFVALAWASDRATRWAVPTRVALYIVTILVALGSLALYGGLVQRPAGSSNAFLFVAVPPVAWVLIAIVVSIAGLISHRQSRRGPDT
jgi:uncharacterized membrane protein